MSLLALVHLVLGIAALATGGAVVLLRKGTRTHRHSGRAYAAAMLALCVLSFGIRGSTPFAGGFGIFHVMAVVSLVTLGFGMREVWSRTRPNWMEYHLTWMLWSYVGLVMAFGSHFVEPMARTLREPLGSSSAAMLVTGFVVWGIPSIMGNRLIPRVARRYAGEVTTAPV